MLTRRKALTQHLQLAVRPMPKPALDLARDAYTLEQTSALEPQELSAESVSHAGEHEKESAQRHVAKLWFKTTHPTHPAVLPQVFPQRLDSPLVLWGIAFSALRAVPLATSLHGEPGVGAVSQSPETDRQTASSCLLARGSAGFPLERSSFSQNY